VDALVRLAPPSRIDLAPITNRPLVQDEPRTALNQAAPPAITLAPPPQSATTQTLAPPQANLEPAKPIALLPPAELARVVARLKQNLTPEMLANFELFLYVSKADAGPWAQHMYVFARDNTDGLDLRYNWLVSTGRERIERNDAGVRVGTFTPAGYYQLDPGRIYRHHTSSEWGQPMPYAMFFDWVHDGRLTGLAIHAASGDDIGRLGSRASAGCIHLSPENAGTLFSLIRTQYRGLAPRFSYDRRTGTMSNNGILLHDSRGRVRLAEGYKVLIFIENFGGNENVVAALF
jgi:lipoprotein-anchoring transpeptidase ErfK/SrfK